VESAIVYEDDDVLKLNHELDVNIENIEVALQQHTCGSMVGLFVHYNG
jgi:hypothetical protein